MRRSGFAASRRQHEVPPRSGQEDRRPARGVWRALMMRGGWHARPCVRYSSVSDALMSVTKRPAIVTTDVRSVNARAGERAEGGCAKPRHPGFAMASDIWYIIS